MRLHLSAMLIFCLLGFGLEKFENSDPDGLGIIHSMYEKYHLKWFRSLVFIQTTEKYRNDSLVNTSTWYETILYPDKFRIDYDSMSGGKKTIFRNDSVYHFSNGKLKTSAKDPNSLSFLLGGMFFLSFEDVIKKLSDLHYDIKKARLDKWQGHSVFVIGARSEKGKTNQLWIDQEKLILLRMITYERGQKVEAIFENHLFLDGGWTETKCTFLVDDKLIQKEYYHDCKANVKLDAGTFDPSVGK